jgi:hypothetical protein
MAHPNSSSRRNLGDQFTRTLLFMSMRMRAVLHYTDHARISFNTPVLSDLRMLRGIFAAFASQFDTPASRLGMCLFGVLAEMLAELVAGIQMLAKPAYASPACDCASYCFSLR